jgi:predicted TIM-barrel fold metal-dependent hydrolase
MVVHDVHQHVWPGRVVEVLRRRRQPPLLDGDVLITPEGRFPVDVGAALPKRRLELLAQRGVDVALVSLQPTLEPSEDVIEAYHEALAELGEPQLRPLAYAEAREACAGAVVSARAVRDLDALAPLLAELEQRSQLLFVHPGAARPVPGAPAWWAPVVDYTAQMQAAYATWLAQGAARWPRLRVLFALLAGGAPFQLERLAPRGVGLREAVAADVYLDTSSYGPRALEFCLSVYGVDRLVHGSDAPVLDPATSLDAVRKFGDNVATALFETNVRRLLG